jgi:hypothetical protein
VDTGWALVYAPDDLVLKSVGSRNLQATGSAVSTVTRFGISCSGLRPCI